MAEVMIGEYDAVIFDMDGTLIDSREGIETAWGAWCHEKKLNLEIVIQAMHGSRAVDTIRKFLPRLTEAQYEHEARRIDTFEIRNGANIAEVSGASKFLASLPTERWGITTSAGRNTAVYRTQKAGLPVPRVLVAGEDVQFGKPDPAGYRLAANRLGVDPCRCLVFEDTFVGLQAGHLAGADIVAVGHEVRDSGHPIKAAIDNYLGARASQSNGKICITLSQRLVGRE